MGGRRCDPIPDRPGQTQAAVGDRMTTVAEYQLAIAKTMTENALQNQFDALADALGWRSYHTHDSRRSPGGFPDSCLVHARHRRLLFVELKTMKGKTSTKQDGWITDLATAGVEVHVLRPIDLLDGSIEALLRRRTR